MLKLSLNNGDQLAKVCKALGSPLRVEIFKKIIKKRLSMLELSKELDTSISTISTNVSILEDAGLITSEMHSASRGTKKVCSNVYSDIFIQLSMPKKASTKKQDVIELPVGHYIDCQVEPSCGLLGDNGFIGSQDSPSSFYLPNRVNAKLIWLRRGYVTYRFPNNIYELKDDITINSIMFSLELCSEAPSYSMEWPSDITFWMNEYELGTFLSPSDFGDRNGKLNCTLWNYTGMSKYGLLKKILINNEGTFIDNDKVSDLVISDLTLENLQTIDFKIGVKSDAENQGGINIFGKGFGDYDQSINMTINYDLNF